jgi:16S rRNA (guanine527-N7)-methyltransferase
VLERAQRAGALGPGLIQDYIDHSRAFVAAWESASQSRPSSILDLGTGGGIPGLVVAEHWAAATVVLLDARLARVTFLADAIDGLGWTDRVTAVHGRAEEYVRHPHNRERFALVTARGFGTPATTAECGAPLVEVGGTLLVSEPPVDASRWPVAGLAAVGLTDEGVTGTDHAHIRRLRKVGATDARYPRRHAAQSRQPLW